jgi:hypothetical protein
MFNEPIGFLRGRPRSAVKSRCGNRFELTPHYLPAMLDVAELPSIR